MSVGLLVCLLFIGHTTFVHSGAVAGGPARRAGKRMHSESMRAHAVQLLNEKIAALMPFKNNYPYARVHAVVYVTSEIFKKKGKRKPTCHFPSSVYSLPSLGVFTFRIVLNRILHRSSLLAPMELLAGRDFVLDLWSEPTLVSSCICKLSIFLTAKSAQCPTKKTELVYTTHKNGSIRKH